MKPDKRVVEALDFLINDFLMELSNAALQEPDFNTAVENSLLTAQWRLQLSNEEKDYIWETAREAATIRISE